MPYLCRSEDALVQQTVYLIGRWGFRFYSMAKVPLDKPPDVADEKLTTLAWSSPGCRYLRFDRVGILLAKHGRHPFFEQEEFKDCRQYPITLCGYSIAFYKHKKKGVAKWHATASLAERQFFTFKSALVSIACEPGIEATMRKLPVLPYAGVRTQLFKMRAAVNQARKAEGLEPLGYDALPPLKRKSIKVFVDRP